MHGFDLDAIYKEIAKSMIRELLDYLDGRDIKIIIDDVEISVRFSKIKVDGEEIGEE